MTFGRFERQARPASLAPDRVSPSVEARIPYDWREQFEVDLVEWRSQFERAIQAQTRMFNAMLAGAVEAARLTGTCGVLVDGMTIRITEDVPYGEVHQAPYVPGAGLDLSDDRL